MKCARQKIYIVELRHIVGLVFDDDRKPLTLEEELKIIEDVVEKVRADEKLSEHEFTLKLIISGLKMIGHPHIIKSIASVTEGRTYSNLVAGFDMVN